MSNLAVSLIAVSVMTAIFVFVLALVLRFRRYDGFMDVVEGNVRLIFQIELETEPEDLRKKKYVKFKIRPMKSVEESQRIHGS